MINACGPPRRHDVPSGDPAPAALRPAARDPPGAGRAASASGRFGFASQTRTPIDRVFTFHDSFTGWGGESELRPGHTSRRARRDQRNRAAGIADSALQRARPHGRTRQSQDTDSAAGRDACDDGDGGDVLRGRYRSHQVTCQGPPNRARGQRLRSADGRRTEVLQEPQWNPVPHPVPRPLLPTRRPQRRHAAP